MTTKSSAYGSEIRSSCALLMLGLDPGFLLGQDQRHPKVYIWQFHSPLARREGIQPA
jgi:hypothetical protein